MEFLTLEEQRARFKASRARIWAAGLKTAQEITSKPEPRKRSIAGYTTCEYGPFITPPVAPPSWRRHLSIEKADSLEAAGYGPYIGTRHKIKLSVQAIKQEICADRGGGQVTVEALEGHGRTRVIVSARQYAMWRIRTELGLSLPQIGREFGGRDHSTVLHAVRTVEAARKAISE